MFDANGCGLCIKATCISTLFVNMKESVRLNWQARKFIKC